jgi:hypothetical protein
MKMQTSLHYRTFRPIRIAKALKRNLIKAFEVINGQLVDRGDTHQAQLFHQSTTQTAEGEEELIFHYDDNLVAHSLIYMALRKQGVLVADVEDDGSEVICVLDPRINTLIDADDAHQIVTDHPYIEDAVMIQNPAAFHFILV